MFLNVTKLLNFIDFKAFLSQNCQNYGIAVDAAFILKEKGIL